MKAEEIKKVLSRIYLGLTLKHEVACKEAIKAVEKTEPRPVCYESDGYADGGPVYDMAYCPACNFEYEEGDKDWGEPFCPHCGQALKWDPEEDEEEGAENENT